mmetsp:Transcript_16266/g.41701  ORF Transcript_16266/g.41701 Transcript_16266/m.41701 type:complete len:285 (-) Transcript_16266:71-925(-)|eukprot:CAMPEP_0177658142 /NCGR_PEP_ID=MMETSP0447-20121125/16635_1 /TAXON_ID=0 /ORGANISM="Stygamoeba regulata, Strain BSH-02190019" /LENGTH=284 /DNA_ID=CAMNT_0019162693 /DNA_START=110 /DNA_END=964 /DNA_ORIENTATION=+
MSLSDPSSWLGELSFDLWFRDTTTPIEAPLVDVRVALGGSAGFLLLVAILRLLMRDRAAFDLKMVVRLHNLFLFVTSLVMGLMMCYGVALVYMDFDHDWEVLFCDAGRRCVLRGVLYRWVYVFYLSKLYEFLDTVLLCLRKKPLTFLHVYHHAITLVLVFDCLRTGVPSQWTGQIVNAFVHVPMYLYYFLTTLGIQPWWKKYITQMQIYQFILVMGLHLFSFYWHYVWSHECVSFVDAWTNHLGIAIYVSYLVLFVAFYISTYKKAADRRRLQDQQKKAVGKRD